jgi:hypothetical protein
MVQHKQTRELYALKYINKTKCVKMKAVANIIQERRLLEEVSVSTATYSLPTHSTDRSTILSSSTFAMHFKTMKIVSSSWISCSVVTYDVRSARFSLPFHLARSNLFSPSRTARLVARGYSTLLRRRNSFSSSLPS